MPAQIPVMKPNPQMGAKSAIKFFMVELLSSDKQLTVEQIVKAIKLQDDSGVEFGKRFGFSGGDEVQKQRADHVLTLVATIESVDVGRIALPFDNAASILNDVSPMTVEVRIGACLAETAKILNADFHAGGERTM